VCSSDLDHCPEHACFNVGRIQPDNLPGQFDRAIVITVEAALDGLVVEPSRILAGRD
jgi:hypothetical protein